MIAWAPEDRPSDERWDAIVNDRLPIIDAAMEQVNGRIVDTLRRTEAETETGLGRLHGLLRRAWLRPLVIGLSLFLGVCGGGGCCSGSRAACSASSRRRRPTGAGAQEQRTLDQLQAQTWGVWLHEDADAVRGAAPGDARRDVAHDRGTHARPSPGSRGTDQLDLTGG